ncbi:hypothetical protein BJ742DRAFT_813840 [Cladochytrium replicatum]|nr:hypothetical protein BJ742DRAFT_813840 [Cladochytrium replicatum]
MPDSERTRPEPRNSQSVQNLKGPAVGFKTKTKRTKVPAPSAEEEAPEVFLSGTNTVGQFSIAALKRSPTVYAPAVTIAVALFAYHIIGLYLFGSGFLLSRNELNSTSTCLNPPGPEGFANGTQFYSDRNECWFPARYSKAVFVLIDALRYDFTVWNDDLAEKANATSQAHFDVVDDPNIVPHFINKLPIFRDLVKNQPANSLLFRARADPPTTTLQRIKGLTTGTLPTFVDMGSNFGGSAINEDNIVDQLNALLRPVVFMGDDTWVGVFQQSMNISFPYPSLDVKDLDTVDDGCIKHIFPFLEKSKSDKPEDRWSFLIAHFLGVDHCGHTWGPDHPAMSAKLRQMNTVLSDIIDAIDDDTLLMVVGDHGMDPQGNHGGDSEDEVNSGLFMYSKKPLWSGHEGSERQRLDVFLEMVEKKLEDVDTSEPAVYLSDTFSGKLGNHRTVAQIDLVPTMSLLLGIPIPHGNLGTIIPELFWLPPISHNTRIWSDSPIVNVVKALRINAYQLHRYTIEYSEQRGSSEFEMDVLEKLLKEADAISEQAFTDLETRLIGDAELDNTILEKFARAGAAYIYFTRTTLAKARRVWAQFDLVLMGAGVVVLALSLVLSVALVTSSTWARIEEVPVLSFLQFAGFGATLGITGLFGSIVRSLCRSIDSAFTRVHEALFFCAVGFAISFLVWVVRVSPITSHSKSLEFLKSFLRGQWEVTNIQNAWNWGTGILLLVLHATSPASDSYTIWEERTTVFILQTFGFLNLIRGLLTFPPHVAIPIENDKESSSSKKQGRRPRLRVLIISVILIVLNRLTQMSTVCRQEMAPFCVPTYNASPNKTYASLFVTMILVFAIPMAALVSRRALKDIESYTSTGKLVATFISPVVLCAGWIYWALDSLEGHNILVGDLTYLVRVKVWWARILFLALSVVSLTAWSSNPLNIGLRVVGPSDRDPSQNRRALLLTGVANTLSSSYFVFFIICYAILAIFQKPMGALAFSLLFVQLVLALDLFTELRLEERRVQVKHELSERKAALKPSTPINIGETIRRRILQQQQSEKQPSKSELPADTTTPTPTEPVPAVSTPSLPSVIISTTPSLSLLFLSATYTSLLAQRLFFATGHQFTLTSIQWELAFIGLDKVSWLLSPLNVLLSTFPSQLLCAIYIPLLIFWNRPFWVVGGGNGSSEVRCAAELARQWTVWAGIVQGAVVTVSTVFAGVFRRHLMVWSVFAPKWMFQAAATGFIDLVGVIVFALVMQVPHRAYKAFWDELHRMGAVKQ